MNYWYVARPNELFIDTDKMSRSIAHTKARLQGAIECGKLDVTYVMQRPSMRPDHCHTIVTLKLEQPNNAKWHYGLHWQIEKLIWEMILHGDIYRGFCSIMRCINDVDSQSVLISPFSFFSKRSDGAWLPLPEDRKSDDSCNCKTKHNSATMQTCPAAIRLRGDKRNMGFFGKPSKNPCKVWPE